MHHVNTNTFPDEYTTQMSIPVQINIQPIHNTFPYGYTITFLDSLYYFLIHNTFSFDYHSIYRSPSKVITLLFNAYFYFNKKFNNVPLLLGMYLNLVLNLSLSLVWSFNTTKPVSEQMTFLNLFSFQTLLARQPSA